LSIEYITVIGHGAVADRIASRCRVHGYRVHQASDGYGRSLAGRAKSPARADHGGAPHPIEETDLVIYAGYGRDLTTQPLTLAPSMLPLLEERMSSGAILAVVGADHALRACAQIAKRPTQVVGLTFPVEVDLPGPPAVHVAEETAPGVKIALLQFARSLSPTHGVDAADAAE